MEVIIIKEAFIKLRHYVTLVDTEISGYGKSIINKDGDIEVQDFIILDQECTSSDSDIDNKIQYFIFPSILTRTPRAGIEPTHPEGSRYL